MSVFSWFIRATRVKSPKNNKASLEQELTIFNNITMWPIAKVKEKVVVQQQEYRSAVTHINNIEDINTYSETSPSVVEQL